MMIRSFSFMPAQINQYTSWSCQASTVKSNLPKSYTGELPNISKAKIETFGNAVRTPRVVAPRRSSRPCGTRT
jgi:hypothetical protein